MTLGIDSQHCICSLIVLTNAICHIIVHVTHFACEETTKVFFHSVHSDTKECIFYSKSDKDTECSLLKLR